MTHLGSRPGRFRHSALSTIRAHAVRVVLDRDLKALEAVVHPNINTVTFTIAAADFARFPRGLRQPIQYVTV